MNVALFIDVSAVAAPYCSALNNGLISLADHLENDRAILYGERALLVSCREQIPCIVSFAGGCALVDALCEILPRLKHPGKSLLVIIVAVGEDNSSERPLSAACEAIDTYTDEALYCGIDHDAQTAAEQIGIHTALEAFGIKESIRQMFHAVRAAITRFRNSGSI